MKGSELVGKTYKPMFPFFESLKAQPGSDTGSFRVLSDTYVTADAGTGIVHQAPFFGEDDYRVCRKFGECIAWLRKCPFVPDNAQKGLPIGA